MFQAIKFTLKFTFLPMCHNEISVQEAGTPLLPPGVLPFMRTEKAMASIHIGTGLPKPSSLCQNRTV